MTSVESNSLTVAFQAVINAQDGVIFAHEALVRGPHGETSEALLIEAGEENQARLDAEFRAESLRLARESKLGGKLMVSILPAALERDPRLIDSLIRLASDHGIQAEDIVLKISENEIVFDIDAFTRSVQELRYHGVHFAIGDFGSGFAGLNLLAEFQPDLVKIDRSLVSGIQGRGPRQAIVRGVTRTCIDLGIDVVAEGIETAEEFYWFLDEGITLFQGTLLAAPSVGRLSERFALPPL